MRRKVDEQRPAASAGRAEAEKTSSATDLPRTDKFARRRRHRKRQTKLANQERSPLAPIFACSACPRRLLGEMFTVHDGAHTRRAHNEVAVTCAAGNKRLYISRLRQLHGHTNTHRPDAYLMTVTIQRR